MAQNWSPLLWWVPQHAQCATQLGERATSLSVTQLAIKHTRHSEGAYRAWEPQSGTKQTAGHGAMQGMSWRQWYWLLEQGLYSQCILFVIWIFINWYDAQLGQVKKIPVYCPLSHPSLRPPPFFILFSFFFLSKRQIVCVFLIYTY